MSKTTTLHVDHAVLYIIAKKREKMRSLFFSEVLMDVAVVES